MEITRRVAEHWMELFIEGRLDGYWAEHLDAGLAEVVRDGNHRLRLDLTAVTFISSAGIGVLVKYYQRLAAIKGTLVIVRASPAVRAVLDMTRLTGMLVDTSPQAEPATLTVGSTVVRRGMVCEMFELQRDARLRLTSIGGEHPIGSPADRAQAPRPLRCPPSTTAIGVGAFGAAGTDAIDRCGEFLAVEGAAVCLPADGTEVADYLVASGTEAPEIQVSRGLVCVGTFARHLRFEPTEPGTVVAISTLAELCLELTGGDAAALVAMVEAEGLVGAALRKSPFATAEDDFFAFPSVRTRLTFTAERAFGGSIALVAGIVQRAAGAVHLQQFAPLDRDGELLGHFHAAAFPFRPFKKGRLVLGETVRTLFEDQSVRGVLHLLHDNRPLTGVGQSEFTRGACWMGALER
jgi:anti-anti-sigma factor